MITMRRSRILSGILGSHDIIPSVQVDSIDTLMAQTFHHRKFIAEVLAVMVLITRANLDACPFL